MVQVQEEVCPRQDPPPLPSGQRLPGQDGSHRRARQDLHQRP
jgi:hypothetical protein